MCRNREFDLYLRGYAYHGDAGRSSISPHSSNDARKSPISPQSSSRSSPINGYYRSPNFQGVTPDAFGHETFAPTPSASQQHPSGMFSPQQLSLNAWFSLYTSKITPTSTQPSPGRPVSSEVAPEDWRSRSSSPGAHSGPSPGARSGPSPGARSLTSPGAHSLTSPGAHSLTSPGARSLTSPGARSLTSPGAPSLPSPGARPLPSPGDRSYTSPGARSLPFSEPQSLDLRTRPDAKVGLNAPTSIPCLKRLRNNLAAKRSRDLRREREDRLALECQRIEDIKARLEFIRNQYKSLLS